MGAWGADSFENDAACDWAATIQSQSDTRFLSAAFARVLDGPDEYVDVDRACEALAAAEVVARMRGNWGTRNDYTADVDRWVETRAIDPTPDLIAQAMAAIDRVLTQPSELLDLWLEGDEIEGWKAAVADLRARVAD